MDDAMVAGLSELAGASAVPVVASIGHVDQVYCNDFEFRLSEHLVAKLKGLKGIKCTD